MTKKINDLYKKIKDAADKEYPCEGKFVPCNSYVICYNCEHNSTFLEGANFMRELMQVEIDRFREIAERDGKDYSDLKAKLDLVNSALQSIETDIQYIGNEIKIRETAKYALMSIKEFCK